MDDYRKPNYLVDNKLRAGEFLMYDCKEEVYVCVDKDTFENCLEDRQKAISRQNPKYPCAPLKNFLIKENVSIKIMRCLIRFEKLNFVYLSQTRSV